MKDVTKLVEIIEELVSELRDADAMITDQAQRLLALEAEIAFLRHRPTIA
jgi:uncharacterized membrane protein affecting hemolysin expression